MRRIAAAFAAFALLASPAQAVNPDEQLADPALEARALELSKELRCVVCQNQSIDDSDATLARGNPMETMARRCRGGQRNSRLT